MVGFTATMMSDLSTNSIRVIKTYMQTHPDTLSYIQCIKNIIKEDGVKGLFGRGLKTRIISNGI